MRQRQRGRERERERRDVPSPLPSCSQTPNLSCPPLWFPGLLSDIVHPPPLPPPARYIGIICPFSRQPKNLCLPVPDTLSLCPGRQTSLELAISLTAHSSVYLLQMLSHCFSTTRLTDKCQATTTNASPDLTASSHSPEAGSAAHRPSRNTSFLPEALSF